MIKKIENINIVNADEIFLGNIIINDQIILKIEKISDQIDINANYCLPAFIDQHTHGGYGINFDDPKMINEENFLNLKNKLKSEGVGRIFFTNVTQKISSLIEIGKKLNNIKDNLIAAWHLEGPFIDIEKKGAHNGDLIIEMSKQAIEEIDNACNLKKLIVIHPSSRNLEIVKKYAGDKKHWFSIGHSNCTISQAIDGLNAGCSQFTHLFNAMSGVSQYHPGAAFAALQDDKSYVELISDNVHIVNDALCATYKICKSNRSILISDCLWVKNLEDGYYQLGDVPIKKVKSHCFLKEQTILAGGAVSYLKIVKNFQKATNATFQEIVAVTSFNTANQFDLKDVGLIKEGINLNIIIVDKNLNLIETYIK